MMVLIVWQPFLALFKYTLSTVHFLRILMFVFFQEVQVQEQIHQNEERKVGGNKFCPYLF